MGNEKQSEVGFLNILLNKVSSSFDIGTVVR